MQVWVVNFFETGGDIYIVGVYSSREKAEEAIEKHREDNGYGPLTDWDKGLESETYYTHKGFYESYVTNLDEMP